MADHPRAPRKVSAAKRPFVFVNMAMSADGKIATADRSLSTFGSHHDKENMMLLRARADAVMAGARTVDAHPVNLDPGPARFRALRLERGLAEYNLRVVVSGSGSINPGAQIFKRRFSPIIVLTGAGASAARLRRLKSLADDVWTSEQVEIDFAAALRWLGKKWNVRTLLCEGGAALNGALFTAGLVDEINLTLCPRIFGGRSAPTIADGPHPRTLAMAERFRMKSVRQIGDELFVVYRREDEKAKQ